MKYVLGLSGGVDSCYVLHFAVVSWKDVVAITFDNGWDTQIAKDNARNICKKLGVEYRVYRCNLNEFREIQRAFLLTGTPHAECPTDVAIKKTLLNALDDYDADKIITGSTKLEGNPPIGWSVVDGLYVKDVMKKHGRVKLRTFPNMTLWDHIRYKKKVWNILDDIDYNPREAKKLLKKEYGWQDYGTKHYENVYTKFNQLHRYYKHDIDMRGVEINHDYNLDEPPASREEYEKLTHEICNKLDLQLWQILNMENGNWRKYRSYRKWIIRIKKLIRGK